MTNATQNTYPELTARQVSLVETARKFGLVNALYNDTMAAECDELVAMGYLKPNSGEQLYAYNHAR